MTSISSSLLSLLEQSPLPYVSRLAALPPLRFQAIQSLQLFQRYRKQVLSAIRFPSIPSPTPNPNLFSERLYLRRSEGGAREDEASATPEVQVGFSASSGGAIGQTGYGS